MPLIEKSQYTPPFYLFSKHLQTILPALFRKVEGVAYNRKRINTPDNDFIDLDWSSIGKDRLAIISHGLEGDTHRAYAMGMVKAFNMHGWDVLAWNYRGCSGEMNKLKRFYHSGETKDLDFVINYVISNYNYKSIVLIGFSIGGNITLKYLGEKGKDIHPLIITSVNFSVPCHLESGAKNLAKLKNKVYMQRFINSLRGKIKAKSLLMPDQISYEKMEGITNFLQFDEEYTAPIHGFKNAHEYWKESSSLFYLDTIAIPTLLVSAKNDPFLTPECFPIREAQNSKYLYLEMPDEGGHCGFYENNDDGLYWSEKRAIEFINLVVSDKL